MRLALIPPIDLLEYTEQTDMQLMLPHLLYDQRYAYTYRQHCKDPEQFVILDNGLAEDAQIDTYQLVKIAVEFGVDEVVAPDVMGDTEGTCRGLDQILDQLCWATPLVPYKFGLQFVAQGQTMHDVKLGISYAMQFDQVTTIALPRNLLGYFHDGFIRHKLAIWFQETYGLERPLHLLGGHPSWPCEIRQVGKWPKVVRSHDTSSPFNFAYASKNLRIGSVASRPDHYFRLPHEAFDTFWTDERGGSTVLDYNVNRLKEWCGVK